MIRLFAAILLMATTSIYGYPAGGSNVDLDKLLSGLDQVDWKGIKNGGFPFITTTTDPTTGQPSVKVTNSLASESKLSSGIGSSLPTSESAGRYSPSSGYSIQPVDSKLTSDVQNKYDWLSSPATPSVDAKKETSDRKYYTTGLNKIEEDQFNWLVDNLKPATPDDTTTKSNAYNSQPSSPNKFQWRPLFNNRPLYSSATTTTGSDLGTPISTNPSSSSSISIYKYPTPNVDTKKETSDKKYYTTGLNKIEEDQFNWLVHNLKPATPDDTTTKSNAYNSQPSSPNKFQWRPLFNNIPLYSSPTTTTGSDLGTPISTNPSSSSSISIYKYPTPSVDTKKETSDKKYYTTGLNKIEEDQFNWLVDNLKPATPDDTTTKSNAYNSQPSSSSSSSSSSISIYKYPTADPTTVKPTSSYDTSPSTSSSYGRQQTSPTLGSLSSDVLYDDTIYKYPTKNPSSTTPSLSSSPVSPSSSGYSVDTKPSVGTNPYSVGTQPSSLDTKIPSTSSPSRFSSGYLSVTSTGNPSPSVNTQSSLYDTDSPSTSTPSRFSSGYPSITSTNYDPYSFNTKPSTSLTADVQPNNRYSAGQTTNSYKSGPASSQKPTPNKGAAPGTLVLTKNNIDLWYPDKDGYADKVNPQTGTY